jgi:hypothetical protein
MRATARHRPAGVSVPRVVPEWLGAPLQRRHLRPVERARLQGQRGPPNDWTGATAWQTTARDRTVADRISDMLARILAEVKLSPRRLTPLLAASEPEAA